MDIISIHARHSSPPSSIPARQHPGCGNVVSFHFPAVKLSYSRLIIDTKSDSICFHQGKDSSEVAVLSACEFAALPPSMGSREVCDAKISAQICSGFMLGWVQGNIFVVLKCSDQCGNSNAVHSISKW